MNNSLTFSRWISTTDNARWVENKPVAFSGSSAGMFVGITSEKQQCWEGFGGCFNELGWLALQKVGETEREKILRELFHPTEGCRFNLCRLPIGANDYAAEWYSLNETEGDYTMAHFSIARDQKILIPYVKKALTLRPDMSFFASPWSPPTWMKFPKAHNYGTLIWKKEILEAYALYLAKFVQAYEAEGIRIDQIHVQNEPNSDQKFPSCLWTGDKMRDFIRDYLGPIFQKLGLKTEIWIGTMERPDHNAWAGAILADPIARQWVSGIGYQWAGKQAIQKARQSWPNMRLLQTENECGNGKNEWDYAHYVFDLMQHYVSNGVVGYTYWNMVLEPMGRSTWGWLQNAMITIDPETQAVLWNPEFYVMKHGSHFVVPGARYLKTEGPWACNTMAFENPDENTVIIAHNPFPHGQSIEFQCRGGSITMNLPPKSFHTFILPG